jgi:hypothetical protein
MSSNEPDDDPTPVPDLFPFDEMSTGETSSLIRRAQQVSGSPDRPVAQKPELKPMTGAQLAFRPSAPPRPQGTTSPTGTQPAFKPSSGTHAAVKPATGTHAAFKPGAPQPAQQKTGTNQFAAFKPPAEEVPEPLPKFDAEKLQAQIRAMSITDSALGRAAKGTPKAPKVPASAVEDTFVKAKMKQAESKVVDFDLDEDLG